MAHSGSQDDDRLLAVYLHDHLAGAAAGVELARDTAKAHAGTPAGERLDELAGAIEADRDSLRTILADLGMSDHHVHEVVAWVAEKAGRLKRNGQLIGRSRLDPVVELETLCTAVSGKRSGWTSLRLLADTDTRLDADHLERLLARADDQAAQLEELRLAAVREAFLP